MSLSITPESKEEFLAYYLFRWKMLRHPWQQPKGSEKDDLEYQSIHRMIIQNNVVVAVGRIHKDSQKHAQIRYMAVDDSIQGKGLGKEIVRSLEQSALEQGVNTISLNARESAVGFYEKLGYTNQGFSHVLYDDIKHFIMTKSLQLLPSHQQVQTKELQTVWHDTIPMSKAMNIEISYFDQQRLITHCEKEFNLNLHQTMFAGSIYTLATLTGWGWVYLQLPHKKISGDIVLAEGNIRYLQPIKGAVHATTCINEVTGTLETLLEGKKARVQINVNVMNGDRIAAIFKGQYVILPKK